MAVPASPAVRWPVLIFLPMALIPGILLGWVTWRDIPNGLVTAINRTLVVRDYVNLWAAGTLVRSGATSLLFDMRGYWGWLRAVYSSFISMHTWSYPPPALFLAVPLSMLSLLAGYAAWTVGTLGLLGVVLRRAGCSLAICAAVLLSPAALDNALAGQNGALLAAGLAGGLLLAGRAPLTAGLCLSLLVLKPQIGLLVPVCLLAAREWRTLGWAALFGGALVLASFAAFGWQVWYGFVTVTSPFMTHTILNASFHRNEFYQCMMPTPFMAMRGWGGSLAVAYGVQGMVSAGCAAAVWRVWSRREVPADLRAVLALALVPLASPYAFSYDMVTTAVAVALLMRRILRDDFLPFEAVVLALAWVWPGVSVLVTYLVGPGIGTAGLAGLGWCAWRRACGIGALVPGERPDLMAMDLEK